MAERLSTGYRRLFETRLLHHYWLDDGGTVFDRMADAARQADRLATYDGRALFDIRPSTATAGRLAGFGCQFCRTALGFMVAAPADMVLPTDATFDFLVAIKSPRLLDYTALTLRPQRIHEIYNPTDERVYRYKENVPRLSNLTGSSRGAGADRALFLSREIPAPDAGDLVESLVRSAGGLLQLTSDPPGASTQQLAAQASDLPVYLHQGDVPAIVAPAELVGVPARGVALSADITDDVFLIVSLTAVRAGDDDFSFVDGSGAPKAKAPLFQVRLRNRSTIWTYLNKRTGAVESSSAAPLPLTFFGNAGTQQKPVDSLVKARMNGGRILQLVSEIHV